MTLDELIAALQSTRDKGASGNSPVTIEAVDDIEGELFQSGIKNVTVERRCEDDDEPTGVYINLDDDFMEQVSR